MKASPEFRNKLYTGQSVYGPWSFFIDERGNVHCSLERPWSDAELAVKSYHNHWLEDDGSIPDDWQVVEDFNKFDLENK